MRCTWCPLEHCKTAIHVRTGERGTDSAISAWLERHDVEIVACADAFEACTVALTQSLTAPDVAFVGIDWLAPDEHVILDYFRETWPNLLAIVYGPASATTGFREDPRTLVCRSPAAVRRMLTDSPAALLDRLRAASPQQARSDDDRQPSPTLPPHADQSGDAQETSLPHPTTHTRDSENRPANPGPRSAWRPAAGLRGRAASASASRNVLTEEELAALLEDGG